ncbi:MAG TPA: hypothetical protein VJ036_03345 [bacterium]|jgi:hypothetical protein|nr:hypothetical protein [bacterium]
MDFDSRIVIFVGAFGSGKTEIAINYVRSAVKQWARVAIVDLDIVTPYFRSRDVAEKLVAEGIEVVVPPGELLLADLPIIVPRVKGALSEPDLHVVVDVGGDDIGATVLGQFNEQLELLPHELLFVVNTCRPFTNNVAGIKRELRSIERASHLKVTGLVANPNLASETTVDIIADGLSIVDAAATETGIPVVGVGVREDLVPSVGTLSAPIFAVNIMLLLPWHRGSIATRDRRSFMTARLAQPIVRAGRNSKEGKKWPVEK